MRPEPGARELPRRVAARRGRDALATHWTFWADSCDHLLDVWICLTPEDTVVVDPSDVRSVGEDNTRSGPAANLAGERGFVVVTAFEPGPNCIDPVRRVPVDDALVGSFTIASRPTSSAFGADADAYGLAPRFVGSFGVGFRSAWARASRSGCRRESPSPHPSASPRASRSRPALIAMADAAMSSGTPPSGLSFSDLNDALATFNENYDECDDEGCLAPSLGAAPQPTRGKSPIGAPPPVMPRF